MGILHEQILGVVKGSSGNLVFKLRKDVNYFSLKPRKKSLPMDTGSVFRRERFRFIGKLSKSIYRSLLIRMQWEKAKTNKTWCVYDDIFKTNYRKIIYNDPEGIPALFPGSGFKLKNPVVQKTETCYKINADGIGIMDNFDLLSTDSITLIGIFLYTHSDSPEYPSSPDVDSFSAKVKIPDILSPFSINMNLTGDIKSEFNSGTIQKAFFTIAFLDKNKHPVAFSEILIDNFQSISSESFSL